MLLKSYGIVDVVVVLEDGCGSSILVDFEGFNIDIWRNARVCFDVFGSLYYCQNPMI